MRILVTNDDGVGAPGIAALAAAMTGLGHDVVVVAPLVDYSGAGAAVGPVHGRDGVDYERRQLEAAPGLVAFGVDGPPALAVILTCVGAFGPVPDLVVSGINHGANVGRSALHSGTVGATLTGAHFGLRGLAVSIRYGEPPVPWATAATLAAAVVPVLVEAPAGTVLNLNVPDVPMAKLRGVRPGALARGGTIRSAVHHPHDEHRATSHLTVPPFATGTLRLDLTPPGSDEPDLGTDAGLVAAGYASLTPLVGVRAAVDAEAGAVAAAALDELRAAAALPADELAG